MGGDSGERSRSIVSANWEVPLRSERRMIGYPQCISAIVALTLINAPAAAESLAEAAAAIRESLISNNRGSPES